MRSRIGCNTVNAWNFPGGFYTKEVYERLLRQYTHYLDFVGWLEFSHVTNITAKDAEAIGQLARELGFGTWSIHSEHLNVGDRLEDYLSLQEHEAEVCAALGCEVMVCHLPNLEPYVDFERDLMVIEKVAELTHAYGIRLAVETCGYTKNGHGFCSDADLVLRVVEELNREDVGINLDTGHCLLGQSEKNPELMEKILSGEKLQWIPNLACRIGKKLFTTHLQDNFGLNDDHQAPGLGYINWKELLPAILGTGYTGPLMMELTDASVAARRTVKQLCQFPLEKEIVFASNYLNFLLQA